MSAQCSKGWSGRCPAAKSRRCKCACGGQNHGNPAAREKSADVDAYETTRKLIEHGWDYVPDRSIRPTNILAVTCRRLGEREEPSIMLEYADRQEPMPQRLVLHSPTGMEFGYGGSGPADLALNVLALVLTPPEAARLHQAFKSGPMAKAFSRDGGTLPMRDVTAWIEQEYAAECADTELMASEAETRAWST